MIGKILFVCTGNTCRSCMAEAIAKSEAKSLGLNIEFSSAGIFAIKGSSASYNASKVMEEMGYNLSCHISKPLNIEIEEDSELILTMTQEQKRSVVNCFPSASKKVFTLMEYVGEKNDIDDPFGGDIDVYRETAAQLKTAIIELLGKIRES